MIHDNYYTAWQGLVVLKSIHIEVVEHYRELYNVLYLMWQYIQVDSANFNLLLRRLTKICVSCLSSTMCMLCLEIISKSSFILE